MNHPSTITFQPGDIIFKEGTIGHCSYFIEVGEVEIFVERDGVEKQVNLLKQNEIFGEMAIIDSFPRSASARAVTFCKLGVIQKEQLNDRLEEADPVVSMIISVLIKRLRREVTEKTGGPRPTSNGTTSFSPKLTPNGSLQAIEKFKLEALLRQALSSNEMETFYQPIVDIKAAKTVGFEALLRWRNPFGNILYPDHFISVCEETNLILPLGRWVIEQALADTAKLIKGSGQNFFVSVNVSGRQLHDEGFFEHLEQHRVKNSLEPTNIKLEMTEQVFVKGKIALNWVEKAHKLGYTLALDDFGTGYSSLQYLSDLPLDFIKIDKSFIQKFEKDPRSDKIVQAIIHLAKSFGIPTIAEGIEEESTFQILKHLGCEFGQGFYFRKAMAIEDALNYIKSDAA